MKRSIFTLLTTLCLTSCLFAQSKKRVAFDSGEKLYVIDKATEEQLMLFPDINDFVKANIFLVNDTLYQIEILVEGKPMIVNKLNENAYYQQQAKVDKYMAGPKNTIRKSDDTEKVAAKKEKDDNSISQKDSERLKLISSIRGFSFAAYAWMLPIGFGAQSLSAYAGGYLMVSGSAILFPYIFTVNNDVPAGASSLYTGGAALGLAHGFLLHASIAKEIDKTVFLTMTGMSIAEGFTMYAIAKKAKITVGQAELMITNSAYAGLAGASLLGYAELFDKNKDNSRLAYIGTLATSLSGYYLGYGISKLSNYTNGDARVFGTVVPLAMYSTASVFFAQKNPDYKTMSGLEALTYLGAVYVGHQLVKNEDFSTAQGSYVGLGTIGGGLFMAGLGLMINDNNHGDFSSTPILAAVGAIGGFATVYAIEKNRNKRVKFSSNRNKTSFDIGLTSIPTQNFKNNKLDMTPGARFTLKF